MRIALLFLAFALPAMADPPDIVTATAHPDGDGTWRFAVTISHPDTGWNHYADGWEVKGPDGTVLGYRELFHPHVDEQPFTRSLGGVVVPKGMDYVLIRAHCKIDGWGDQRFRVNLPLGASAD